MNRLPWLLALALSIVAAWAVTRAISLHTRFEALQAESQETPFSIPASPTRKTPLPVVDAPESEPESMPDEETRQKRIVYEPHSVAVFSGSGIRSTQPFTVTEPMWAVSWSAQPEDNIWALSVTVTAVDGDIVDLFSVGNETTGTVPVYAAAGVYYLRVNSLSCSWGLVVSEPRQVPPDLVGDAPSREEELSIQAMAATAKAESMEERTSELADELRTIKRRFEREQTSRAREEKSRREYQAKCADAQKRAKRLEREVDALRRQVQNLEVLRQRGARSSSPFRRR